MRAKNYYIHTIKKTNLETEIISYQLMIRSGMIKKIASGIYTYMPIGLRILQKITEIVREEMNNSNLIEILMPFVQPAELWKETGRYQKYGTELLRINDRHRRDFVLQPTSEEVITDIVRNDIQSYKQLPVKFYHIQTKFRDEIRPRFGVMRAREFLMKDAYSFDRNEKEAMISYNIMFETYERIFNKLGLKFKAVAADTGSIGGSKSHEFHVMVRNGEDMIAYNETSKFAANIELAEAPLLIPIRKKPLENIKKIYTPEATKCSLVAERLNISIEKTVKSIILTTEDINKNIKIHLLLIRGDHTLNEFKIRKIEDLSEYRFSTEQEILNAFSCKPGYIGPVKISKNINVIADKTVANMSDFVCGANTENMHYIGVNWERDLPLPSLIADIRNIEDGDPDIQGHGNISVTPGIEIGHIFYLGKKYSAAMKAQFLDQHGKNNLLEMGCYGIGISRIMGASIEQNHDEKGIIWSKNISPFQIVICPINFSDNSKVQELSNRFYDNFIDRNIDVIIDDRPIRTGVMFYEWELIGIPIMIVISDNLIKDDLVEIRNRHTNNVIKVNINEVVLKSINILQSLR